MTTSNENDDRNNRDFLTGADAQKELGPQEREALERIRRDQDPNPRKVLRETALLRSEFAYREGISIPQSVRIQLWECGLEDQDIDTWDRLRLTKRSGEPFTPEQDQEYRRICRLVNRCLQGQCDGGDDPLDDDNGHDFEGPIWGDIADAHAKKDAEAKPAPIVPQPEPAPVLPDLTPKAEAKRKPKRKPSTRQRKDDQGRG